MQVHDLYVSGEDITFYMNNLANYKVVRKSTYKKKNAAGDVFVRDLQITCQKFQVKIPKIPWGKTILRYY